MRGRPAASYPCPVQSPALRRVRSWAQGALRLEAGRPWQPEPAPEQPDELLAAIARHRVTELIAGQAHGLGVPEDVRTSLERLRKASRRALMVQVLETERVAAVLQENGVASLVIKGPALAVQSAGDPGARGAGDIDLLIDRDQVEEAHEILLGHGWTPRAGNEVVPGTWAWRHVLNANNAFTYDGPGSTVDLHWRLDPTLDGLPDFAQVWARRATVTVDGIGFLTLGRGDVLAHTSLHAAKDSWRWMRNLVDVHRLARDPQTWEEAARIAPLRRLEVDTLAVTRFVLGLPPAVPTAVLRRVDRVPGSVLVRARTALEQPAYPTYPLPGRESARQLRYLVAASGSPRDLAHSVVSTAIPLRAVVGIEASSAWTGVPLTLWHRLRRVGRRAAAWARREPGAGVVDAVVKVRR